MGRGRGENDLVKKNGLLYLSVAHLIYWSGRVDLNHRPSEPHSDTLPGCATPRLHCPWSLSPQVRHVKGQKAQKKIA